ncbi:hypothetical protein [Castellaniella denitrificans]|uniref:hypothetical protein n=1 Tax=Castellaniella denitrificans TaxID=56119 RepID=UPI00360DF63D
MTLESKAAFARRLGVNKSTITRAAQAGRLVMEGGEVNVEASLARWHATQGGRPDVAERFAEQRGQAIPDVSTPYSAAASATAADSGPLPGAVAGELHTQPYAQPAPDAGSADRTHYKALTLRFENETIKLEMALRRHMRYPLPSVRREAYGLGLALRASVERMVDQTAPRLAAAQTPERRALLIAECHALTRAMHVEFVRALRRLRASEKKS